MADIRVITVFISLAILAFLVKDIYQKKYKPIYLSLILFFFLAYCLSKQQLQPNLISAYISDETKGVSVNIIGIVDKIQEKETYKQIYLKENTITLSQDLEVSAYSSGVILSVNEYNCEIGDTIRVTGMLKEFPTSRNIGGFDSKQYYKTLNIEYRCSGTIEEIIKKNDNEILSILYSFKKQLKSSYATIANEKDSGLYNSIVIGDKEGLLEDINDLYKDNGIAHLLAISGLNVSIIGMSLYKILRKTGMKFLMCAVISAGIIICYGIITGNEVSAMRALIMFIIVVGAGIFGRAYDILSATSVAAIIILMDSPTMLLNCGFLLSFGAMLGIVITAPAIINLFYNNDESKAKKSVIKNVFLSLIICSSISLTTLPIILYFYFQIPIYSVVLNIIVIPLTIFVMISAISGGLLGLMFKSAGVFCVGMAHYILVFYEILCVLFSKLPYSLVIVGQPRMNQIIVFYLLLVFLIAYIKYAKSVNKWVALLIPVMIMIILYRSREGLEIDMIDVGQGDSIFVRTPQNTTYLFDGGSSDIKNVGEYRIVPFLKANGISTLDYIVVSHIDKDHINGISEMLKDDDCYGITIKNIILPLIKDKESAYIELEDAIKNKGIPILYVKAGDEFGDESVSMKCLHPSKTFSYSTQNGYSTTVSLNYKNFDMLFTGDLETDGEDVLINKKVLKDYDVLKVAHHGSMYSSQEEFLDIIKPEISIISCGVKNSYGHPHQELLTRLKSQNSETYITSQCGQITIRTDGYGVEIERFLKTIKP